MSYKKILIPFTNNTIGGSHYSANNIALGFNKNSKKYKYEILIPSHSASKNIFCTNQTTKIHIPSLITYLTLKPKNQDESPFSKLFLIFRILYNQIFIFKFLYSNKFFAVNPQDSLTLLTWFPLAKLFNIKIIWHCRQYANNFLIRYFYGLLPDILISLNSKCYYHKKFKTKTFYVQNIYDINYYKSIRKYNVKKNNLKLKLPFKHSIIILGNLCERKNQLISIKIVESLKQKGIDVNLIIIGDSKNTYASKVKTSLGNISDRVSITDSLSLKIALSILKLSNILMILSTNEAGPRSLIDAIAFNKFIISTDVGNVRLLSDEYNKIIIIKDPIIENVVLEIKKIFMKRMNFKQFDLVNKKSSSKFFKLTAPKKIVKILSNYYDRL